MKNPGESSAGGNEPNFDANNTVQAPERPRGFFRRIGDKISDIVESHNRQMQDKQALSRPWPR